MSHKNLFLSLCVWCALLIGSASPALAATTYTISGNTSTGGVTLGYTDGIARMVTSDAAGNYSFSVPSGWTGGVIPSKSGYSFNPSSKYYANLNANQVQNFTVSILISGNAGVGGALLSYTPSGSHYATADANGNYSFTVTSGWTGTVTPVKPGSLFTPGTKSYSSVHDHLSGENYTTAAGRQISGSAGMGFTAISYVDPTLKTIYADGLGNYTITVPDHWSGTVTPSLAGYPFTPANRIYDDDTSDLSGQDYTPISSAVLTVTNTANSGPSSLYQVIRDAPDRAKIVFDPALAGQTITLTYPLLIEKNLTIDGSGLNPRITLSGGNTVSVFYIDNHPIVTLQSLILKNAVDGNGGAIFADSSVNLTVKDSSFQNNSATAGSAIYAGTSTSITVQNTDFGGNHAGGGGAIYAGTSAALTVIDSTFVQNSGQMGGAIFLSDATPVTILDSELTSNSAVDYGGAIYGRGKQFTLRGNTFTNNQVTNSGGAIDLESNSLTLDNNIFSGNTAGYAGAALIVPDPNSPETILENNTFSANTAGYAGALYIAQGSSSPVSLRNNLFSGNRATTTDGGAVYLIQSTINPYVNLENNTFAANQAAGYGGAVYSKATSVLRNNTFSANRADQAGGSAGASLYLSQYLTTPVSTSLYNNIFANNTGGGECAAAVGAAATTGSNNLVEDGSSVCLPTVTGDPLLGPLADNGGPVQSMALLPGSPAIDAGDDATCLSSDQRGVSRPQGSHCDLGAYELFQQPYTITGNAGAGGASFSYAYGGARTVTADASGNYSLQVSQGWSGTVTPSKAGYTFSPASRGYDSVSADQTGQDYTPTAITYIISGNAGVGGTSLGYTDGGGKTATADASGNYSFTVPYNWSGTVTPSKAGYTFTPAGKSYANVLADQGAENYTPAAITHTISGSTGTGGATLSYTDGSAKTATADASGNYSFTVPYGWSGTVTPSKAGYTFTPASKIYTNLLVDQSGENYITSVITFIISGTAGSGGAVLDYSDGSAKTATADASGNYSITVPYAWTGTVTPSKPCYSFVPPSKSYSNITANQTNQNYSAPPSHGAVAGNAGVAGAVLSYLDRTYQTVTADANGNYVLWVIDGWTGTITPAKTGYLFTPPSRLYTNYSCTLSHENYTVTPGHLISGSAGTGFTAISYVDQTLRTIYADQLGNYIVTVPDHWSGTLTPSLASWGFTPGSRSYSDVTTDLAGQDFAGLPTVTTTADSGPGSLRQVIADAPAAAAVVFDPSLAGKTIVLASEIKFTRDVTLDGSGLNPRVTVSGNNATRILNVTQNTAVTLQSLIFKNAKNTGFYGFGGAIYADFSSALTVKNSDFVQNLAGGGGAIFATSSAEVTITNSTFTGNSANTGGVLLLDYPATVTIQDSEFSSNSADNVGGAIAGYLPGAFTLRGSTFTNNQATESGGAMWLSSTSGQTLENNTFSGNTAKNAGALLFAYDTASPVYLRNNLFSGNSATQANGGALSLGQGSTITQLYVDNNTFYANQAAGYGGAIYTTGSANLRNNTFSANRADQAGGSAGASLYLTAPANLVLYNNLFAHNTGGGECAAAVGSIPTTGSNNLVQDGSAICKPTITGDPLMGPLADQGGPVLGMALLPGSPAIDAGDDATCLSSDQRGVSRPEGSHCDLGAYELRQYSLNGNAGTAGVTLSYTDGSAKTATAGSDGTYSLSVSSGWSGTIVPSKAGYTFTPANKSYTNLLANQSGEDYAASAIFYTISGNASLADTFLSYTDGSAKTTSVDASGNYSFTVPYGWSGTVTPSRAGYTFTPHSKSYTNLLADQANENYTAAAVTYTISGNTGTGGASLSYTDGSAQTATADASGNYSFSVSYQWSGIVTPSKVGYTFSPANKAYTNLLADQSTENYAASALTYTISGNAGAAGTVLSYTDGSAKTATANASGGYSFSVSYSWTGEVTPSKAGYTFTPSSNSYTNVLANQSGENYAASAITYTISGSASIGGTTLSYTDGSAKTATADTSGNYSLMVPYSWSGTVTPSKAGYTFTPADRSYSNLLADQAGEDYTASAITYTISGNTGTGGASLRYTDGEVKTSISDASGNYSFSVSDHWSGTVTPSKLGYTFTPPNKTYASLTANRGAENYTAAAITYTISGSAGTGGVTLSYTDGGAKMATADASGSYSFSVSYDWTGDVTPSKAGYTFTPHSRTYADVLANQGGEDYTPTAITYTISGTTGVAGVTLSYTDGSPKTATADGSGNYSFTVPHGWSGKVTPSKVGFTFMPSSKSYANLLADQPGEDYTPVAITFILSGNTGNGSVTLSYTDGSAKTVTTDADGNYSLSVSDGWSGTVTPSKAGYTFMPASRIYSAISTDQTGQDYAPTAITYTISGNAGTGSASLSYTDGGGKTATADASGNYSFTVPYNWSGTVTPSKAGYTFTPPSKSYANLQASQGGEDYAASAITYILSGNAGVGGATLNYMDGTLKTITADANGLYTLPVSYHWSGTVTPVKIGYTFTPVSRSYIFVTGNPSAQDFTAATAVRTISGKVALAGTLLNYTDGSLKTVKANSVGNYTITVPYGWSGSVTPAKTGYAFTPASRSYSSLTVNQASQNYSAARIRFTISGSAGVGAATLSYVDGVLKKVTSDVLGNYHFTVSYNWSGKVTPSKAVYIFTPGGLTYTNVLADQAGQNYTAAHLAKYGSIAVQDGWVLESGQGSGAGGTINASATTLLLGDNAANRQYRTFLSFNTAGLPDNALIQSVTLRIKQNGPAVGSPLATFGALWVDMQKGAFGASPMLAAEDFAASASTAQAGSFQANGAAPADGWYGITLDASSLNLSGLTQLRLYFETASDADQTPDYLKFNSANAASNRPQLVVTYTMP